MIDETPADADLPVLLIQSRFMFLQMARTMLGCDLEAVGWHAEIAENARLAAVAGQRLALEISSDARGDVAVSLVVIARDGTRRPLGVVRETQTGAAN